MSVLVGLRTEVEARQSGDWTSLPEIVLVVAELATVVGDDDFGYVLRYGRECGVRVLAATADMSVERSVVVDSFDSLKGIVGVRIDLTDWTALKAEYRQTREDDKNRTIYEGLLNWSWGF